ncbi:hypothetical protein [Streptomyces sp. MUSC 125]|uniref:hypothetical protein n=1 Tax=Streptomyces sp. MUSC 125 TaxID=1428624 RepID=UPI00131D548B|nr:hypothetical protein [Streptomyces sp. MUSC 125]
MTQPLPTPVPDEPADREPLGYQPTPELHALVLTELEAAGVELGTYDQRIAEWLGGLDYGTTATILGWSAAPTADPATPRRGPPAPAPRGPWSCRPLVACRPCR